MRPALVLPLALLALLFAVPPAAGQVIYVRFRTDDVAKRFKKHLTRLDGRDVLIGEIKSGITIRDDGTIVRTNGAEAKNSVEVGDPANPTAKKRSTVSFAGDDVAHMGYVDRVGTLDTIAAEYQDRLASIEGAQEKRDALEAGTHEWFIAHNQMLTLYDKLATWLVGTGYPEAAKRHEKEADKERKGAAKAATDEREKAALASLQKVATPEALVQASQKITGGSVKFKVQESQHLRIVHDAVLADGQIEGLLKLGEKIIEGFRREFVDPYRAEDYPDWIPDARFHEWFLGPPDVAAYEQFYVEYYGAQWGKDKERRLQSKGTTCRGRDLKYVAYWRIEDVDLEGIVTHTLGHTLADLHYNAGKLNDVQPWLEEAVGYYLSFGYLGRNSVTCYAIAAPTYAKAAPKEGEKTLQIGLRAFFNELALGQGPPLDVLVRKTLAEISDPDFAKAWSFFDWLAQAEGRRGQDWLRMTCKAKAMSQSGFAKEWRARSEELFGVEGEDVFRTIEEKWRTFAQSRQRKE